MIGAKNICCDIWEVGFNFLKQNYWQLFAICHQLADWPFKGQRARSDTIQMTQAVVPKLYAPPLDNKFSSIIC